MRRFMLFTFLTVLFLSTNVNALTSTFSDACATISLTGPSIDPGSPYYIEASGRNNLGSFHNASLYIDEHYSGYSSSSVFNPSFTQNFGTFTGAHTFKLTILCGTGSHDLNWRFVELTVARKDLKKMAADICTAIQSLQGGVFKNNPDQRKNTLCEKIGEVIKLIESAEATTDPVAKKQLYKEAIDKLLNDIGAKMDGYLSGDSKDDWIINEAAQRDIYPRVQQLVGELVNLL